MQPRRSVQTSRRLERGGDGDVDLGATTVGVGVQPVQVTGSR